MKGSRRGGRGGGGREATWEAQEREEKGSSCRGAGRQMRLSFQGGWGGVSELGAELSAWVAWGEPLKAGRNGSARGLA